MDGRASGLGCYRACRMLGLSDPAISEMTSRCEIIIKRRAFDRLCFPGRLIVRKIYALTSLTISGGTLKPNTMRLTRVPHVTSLCLTGVLSIAQRPCELRGRLSLFLPAFVRVDDNNVSLIPLVQFSSTKVSSCH